MKNFAVILFVVAMLVFTFNVVYPQKKENPYHGKMSIQEKMMEIARGIHNEQRLNIPREFDKRETKFSKILSDTAYVQIYEVMMRWDALANLWDNFNKYAWVYDTNGNQTEELFQLWKVSEWVNFHKVIYTYDLNGNQTEKLFQLWKVSEWVNSDKAIYTYDLNGNQTEELFQLWKVSAWVNSDKVIYTYDLNGNLMDLLVQSWNNSAWVNSDKVIYTYDLNGNLMDLLVQFWNNSAWVNYSKYTWVYDANRNQTEELHQSWDNSAWVNYSKYTWVYDANRNQTEQLRCEWNGNAWVNYSKYTWVYDANGNRTEELRCKENGSMWINLSKYIYTWQIIVKDAKEKAKTFNSFTLYANYPNPFNPQTKISFTVPKESYITLKVYDILGREVTTLAQEKKQPDNYSITWSAKGLPGGVYFYRLVAEDFVDTKKMILMK